MNIKKQRPVLVMEQGGKKEKREIKQVDYEEQQRPDSETLGHYAQQLRENLGV